MPQTPTKPRRAAKAPPKRKRTTHTSRPAAAVDRTAKLSEDVLETIEKSQRVAIDAVRKFVDTVDHALPALPHGDGPTARRCCQRTHHSRRRGRWYE